METMSVSAMKKAMETGDHAVLGFIFQEYGPYCINRLQKHTSCGLKDAEDALMEAIVRFRRQVLSGKVQQVTHLREYIFRICLNVHKEQQRQRLQAEEHTYEVRSALYDQQEQPEVYQQKKEVVLSSFYSLGERCRQILSSFYVDDMSLSDIADKLDMASADVAKTARFRCFKKWLQAIEDKQQRSGVVQEKGSL